MRQCILSSALLFLIVFIVVISGCQSPSESKDNEIEEIFNPLPGSWVSSGSDLSDFYVSSGVDSLIYQFTDENYLRRQLTRLAFDDETLWLEAAGTYLWISDSLGKYYLIMNEVNTSWQGVFEIIEDPDSSIHINLRAVDTPSAYPPEWIIAEDEYTMILSKS